MAIERRWLWGRRLSDYGGPLPAAWPCSGVLIRPDPGLAVGGAAIFGRPCGLGSAELKVFRGTLASNPQVSDLKIASKFITP